MLIYYVYAYLRKNGTPYYIGKGKGRRVWEKHTVPVPKDKSRVVFLEKNLTNIGACALERRYIRWYGRQNIGTGILRNLTDGGEGTDGYSHSESSKKLIGEALKGKPKNPKSIAKRTESRKSYVTKDETRKKLSEALKGKPKPPFSEEHRRKIREAILRREPPSEETRAKLREAGKKRWAKWREARSPQEDSSSGTSS